MYGLPKTHKKGTPLCSILSMTGLSHHDLGKWLAGLLQPMLERFSSNCTSDLFTFAKTMQNPDIDPNVFMCSFDEFGVLASVLDETIKKLFCDKSDLQPLIPKNVLVELMKNATSSVEFSYNNTMYKHTDVVAMRSILDTTLANIFVRYYEKKLFSDTRKPPICFRYVNDTFAIFNHEPEADKFLTKLNGLYLSLKFTFKNEKNKCLSLYDVYDKRTNIGLETSVYRKPTFTGQYLRWQSFNFLKRKINLISTVYWCIEL